MSFAPVVMFVYNRPIHTLKTLNALKENILAEESDLYIYCDGPKSNSDFDKIETINEVRRIAKELSGFKKVIVKEELINKGLANSIIDGVSEIINIYGKVIVLEDDILVAKGFLKYMNDALELYESEPKVGCIHAWNYSFDVSAFKTTTFFLKGADCWGWATWSDRWQIFNPNGKALLDEIRTTKQEFEFNRRGTHAFVSMLKDQINKKNDSWAIRWHASLFLAGFYCLHPTISIVKNIGLDGSGTHSGTQENVQNVIDRVIIEKKPVEESELFFEQYRKFAINGSIRKIIFKYIEIFFRKLSSKK